MAGGAAGAIEKILGRAGVAGAGIEGVLAGGMRVGERQQVVEEGLCCLRARRRSSNNKEVGGWRSCRCSRQGLGRAGVSGAGIKGASAGGMRVAESQQVVEECL